MRKKYDTKLLKRLLSYAKPYISWFGIALLCMVIATALDLARPVLIGRAVDIFVNGYKEPFQVVDANTPNSITYDGVTLQKQKNEYGTETALWQMVHYNNEYYLLKDIRSDDASILYHQPPQEFGQSVQKADQEQIALQVSGKIYRGQRLDSEQLKQLRSIDYKGFLKIASIFLGTIIIGFIFVYIQSLILQHVGQKIIYTMRIEIYEHMLDLPLRFFIPIQLEN